MVKTLWMHYVRTHLGRQAQAQAHMHTEQEHCQMRNEKQGTRNKGCHKTMCMCSKFLMQKNVHANNDSFFSSSIYLAAIVFSHMFSISYSWIYNMQNNNRQNNKKSLHPMIMVNDKTFSFVCWLCLFYVSNEILRYPLSSIKKSKMIAVQVCRWKQAPVILANSRIHQQYSASLYVWQHEAYIY